eukprot:114840_1
MGLLWSMLFRRLFSYKEFKICLVGLNNAGKTTTLYKLHLGEVVSTQPTIGSNVEEVVHNNIKFQVWDLGGQESLRRAWSTYFLHTHAVIFVVDSTDRERIHIVKDELFEMMKHEDLAESKLLIFANKQDMTGCLTEAEIASQLNLVSITDHEWHIQECCAITGDGLYEGLDWLTQHVKQ